MDETTAAAPRPIDPLEVDTATRLGDLLVAVRMSWDEVFDLPEPRPLTASTA